MPTVATQSGVVPLNGCRILSAVEIKTVEQAIAADPKLSDLRNVIHILLHTGIRPGELAQLRWTDIDLCKMVITVGEKSHRRLVPFSDDTQALLSAMCCSNHAGAVFVLGKSPAAMLRRLARQLRQLSSSLGIKPHSFYALRCTWACRMLAAGLPPYAFAAIGGWSVAGMVPNVRHPSVSSVGCSYRDAVKVIQQEGASKKNG